MTNNIEPDADLYPDDGVNYSQVPWGPPQPVDYARAAVEDAMLGVTTDLDLDLDAGVEAALEQNGLDEIRAEAAAIAAELEI